MYYLLCEITIVLTLFKSLISKGQAMAVRENEKLQSFGDVYFSALDSNVEEKVPTTILAEAKSITPMLLLEFSSHSIHLA